MRYAPLGHTGLIVSRVAFGAMTFTAGNKDLASIYKVGTKLAADLVGTALDAGVNLFDTADGYANGESEAAAGRRPQAAPRGGGARDQGGVSHRYCTDPVGPVAPAYPVVGRAESAAPRPISNCSRATSRRWMRLSARGGVPELVH